MNLLVEKTNLQKHTIFESCIMSTSIKKHSLWNFITPAERQHITRVKNTAVDRE